MFQKEIVSGFTLSECTRTLQVLQKQSFGDSIFTYPKAHFRNIGPTNEKAGLKLGFRLTFSALYVLDATSNILRDHEGDLGLASNFYFFLIYIPPIRRTFRL